MKVLTTREAEYIQGNRSYNFKPNNNLPNHYTPAHRNHENLSYGGGVPQGQCKTFSRIMFHGVSKDNNIKAAIE